MRELHKQLSKHILADGLPIELDLENSHGSYIKDRNGDEYIDMFSMFASSPVGYNHPHIVSQQDFLGKMAINKPAMSDAYPYQYADIVNTFERVAMPKELSYCFFISGGTLAVENALKTAFDWKTRLNLSRGIQKEASQVIHFKQAFHGRSGYTLSLTNTKDPRKYMYFPKFDWPRITNPKLTFPITEDAISETIQEERLAIKQIEEALQKAPHEVACLIIEPIQAEGGDNHFRKEFFKKLRQICDEHEILLILDEVQTGLAMTGKMWAFQHYDIIPDVIAFGKKSQVCGILANREKLDQVENHVFKESSRINSTFGGNFIDMIRFKLILEIIEKEKLVEKAEKTGEYLLDKITKLTHTHKHLSNARGLGLLVAFDFDTPEQRDAFVHSAFENKMIILGCGERSVRFRPHLTATIEDIDKAIAVVEKSL
ncbi:L-lysine 6-transaminase [Sphingobacterium psychroaquaticum]|uniref:L-lysine-epsilon aminotransferase n=1 Tax=Sphingobacterium psychroaquaticum TaxID=561061 RepID=A0A1X7K081_9SPHI|nr:L-lysine 6-transaminase [Sphingobacterium psychroaquaticum]SMG34119.1 L-lysine 6-transaminase [Sphingobacterium psychroaquaticum]